jgi:GNAT superfamily N-acetyltransferase
MTDADGTNVVRLTAADVTQALSLSQTAHWNQNAADWRMMLSLGRGFGIRAVDEHGVRRLAASVLLLPYGPHFAWISMVLVMPQFQRRGLATTVLRHALGWLGERGMAGVLDATPAGHAVYAQEGFVDAWGFARYRREAGVPMPPLSDRSDVRPIAAADWLSLEPLDEATFGASRMPLLRALAERWPGAARVLGSGHETRGYMFGRDGHEAHQIGPLRAEDMAGAKALISVAMREAPGAVHLDLLDARKPELLPWLEAQGFALQRPFTRMVWGSQSAPGDTRYLWAVAGPELG